MPEEVQKAPAKAFEHCCRVFNSMRAEAVPIQLKSSDEEARHALVYQGHTTKLFRMLNMPSPYYTSVLTTLQLMGCIKQLSRGGGSAESRWELLDDPTLELFNIATAMRAGEKQSRLSIVEQKANDQEQRIQALEQRLEQTGS